MALHGFYPNNATYNELWFRMYLRLLPGYVSNNNQKFFSYIRSAFNGGIDYGGGPTRDLRQMFASPQWDCSFDNYQNPLVGPGADGWCYLNQNQGNKLLVTPGTHWFYVEWHIKLNTFNQRNGIWELYIDDCGTTGVCSGSPTRRAFYDNVGWKGGSTFNGSIGSMWMDIWGNPADVGTLYFDNLVVATTGPIGFVGSSGALPAPQNLRVQ
jgi:hypothetical protein